MPRSNFHQAHWDAFRSTPFERQPAVGDAPLAWATRFGADASFETKGGKSFTLDSQPIDRARVRSICLDPNIPVWAGYISAMAWGMQGAAGRVRQASEPLGQRHKIEPLLTALRSGTLGRREAYDAFLAARVSYLGPSYFTKLLHFFDPSAQARRYIMDQWTAKSVNLLAGRTVVHLTSGTPTPTRNTGESYEAFCLVIDAIANALGQTGEEVEQRLFSSGGRKKDVQSWRAYVRQHWQADASSRTYRPEEALRWATGLLAA